MPFTVGLLFTLAQLAVDRLLRTPVTALLLAGWGRQEEPPWQAQGLREHGRNARWLLLSALIGIDSHLAWDAFTHDGCPADHLTLLHNPPLGGLTVARLLEYVSTAVSMAMVGRFLWRHLDRPRTEHSRRAHLNPRQHRKLKHLPQRLPGCRC
ncbi:DUF4184 family protein [Streptomyces sp. NPDC051776]|uniref:DUF4184 family protein n=1 Tax=Streptomyces sp. NPDC051776 TaxID=3155414 RepID=UPI00341801FF